MHVCLYDAFERVFLSESEQRPNYFLSVIKYSAGHGGSGKNDYLHQLCAFTDCLQFDLCDMPFVLYHREAQCIS